MSDENQGQNGVHNVGFPGGELKLKSGEKFLFVRMGENGEFQILFSNVHDALVLHKLADRWLDLTIIDPSVRPAPAISAATPGFDVAGMQRRMKGLTKS